MTAHVKFFCTSAEEQQVVRYLFKSDDIRVYELRERRLVPRQSYSVDDMPAWPEAFEIYIWRPIFGSLVWFTSRPSASGETHDRLVTTVLAGEAWDAMGLGPSGRMLDNDLSPMLLYKRAGICEGRIGPCEVLAPPSSPERVGAEYKRWVTRTLAWIRRRGTIVHDWRKPSTRLWNPDSLLTTTYALPNALREIESAPHKFGFWL
jgi:hypothetical protein